MVRNHVVVVEVEVVETFEKAFFGEFVDADHGVWEDGSDDGCE